MATRIVCTLLVCLLVGVAVQAEPVKIDDAINPRGMISASISPDGRNIAAVPDEPDTLVIRSRTGRDTYALFNYDVKKRQQGEMLAGHPAQDILSYDGIDQGAFDYVATGGAIPSQVWFDASWAQMQKLVDSLLPNRINNLDGDPKRHLLIRSYGDLIRGRGIFSTSNERD
jgi:hypothetical protein